jgi:plasmid stabilization system protein ParE
MSTTNCSKGWTRGEGRLCVKGDFEVRYTNAARDDLLRLLDFLVMRAETLEDFDTAQFAVDTIRVAVEVHLGSTSFIFRRATESPFLGELVIPFGRARYVALNEIEGRSAVNVLGVRHPAGRRLPLMFAGAYRRLYGERREPEGYSRRRD